MLRDEDIEIVRESITMRQVADAYGISVNRHGMAKCPFHGDSHPSMKVYDGHRGYYCFVCHAGGDVIDFARRHDGLTFEQAVKHLASLFGIVLTNENPASPPKIKKALLEKRAARETAEKARKERLERLSWLSGQIHRLKDMQAEFTPLSGIWRAIQKRLEKYELEWEIVFDENADR